jgi:hypothetical protein
MNNNIIDFKKPNIRIINNFLTDEECDKILSVKSFSENLWSLDFDINYPKEKDVDPALWPSITQWDGMCINFTNLEFYERYKLDKEYFENLAKRMKPHTEEKFNVTNLLKEQYLINRWRIGREQAPHLDYFLENERDHDYEMLAKNNIPKDWLKSFEGRFQTKHYSTLIYLNDDYVGGELWFPQYENFTIKPKKGMLVTFQGDENTLHGVKAVTEGTRYTISMFWTDPLKQLNK